MRGLVHIVLGFLCCLLGWCATVHADMVPGQLPSTSDISSSISGDVPDDLVTTVYGDTIRWQLPLTAGINYVSIPGAIQENMIPQLFANILPHVDSIQYFDVSTQSWLSFIPGLGDLQDLRFLPSQRGFYLSILEPCVLELVGEPLSPSLGSLAAGWNPVGPALSVPADQFAQAWGLDTSLSAQVWGRDAHGAPERLYDAALKPGTGYWLHLDSLSHVADEAVVEQGVDIYSDEVLKMQQDLANLCGEEGSDNLISLAIQVRDCEQKIDEAEDTVRETLETHEDCTEVGDPIAMEGFKITEVRYCTDNEGRKFGGWGLLSQENLDPEMAGLLTLVDGAVEVRLTLIDGKVVQALSTQLPKGLRVGQGADQTFLEHVNSLDIVPSGSLQAEVSWQVPGLSTEGQAYLTWEPELLRRAGFKEGENGPSNYVSLHHLLGEQASVASVWMKDDAGVVSKVRVTPVDGVPKELFLRPPATTEGVFEPHWSTDDSIHLVAGDNPYTWLPGSMSTGSDGSISFQAPVRNVEVLRYFSPIGGGIVWNVSSVKVDENGFFSAIEGLHQISLQDSLFLFGDSAGVASLLVNTYDMKTTTLSSFQKRPNLKWNPSFGMRYAIGEQQGWDFSGHVYATIQPQIAMNMLTGKNLGDVIKLIQSGSLKGMPAAKEVGKSLVGGFHAQALGEIKYNLGDLQEAGFSDELNFTFDWESYLRSVNSSAEGGGADQSVYRAAYGYKVSQDVTIAANDWQFSLGMGVDSREEWDAKGGLLKSLVVAETDKENYQARIDADGHGALTFPQDFPLVGGETLEIKVAGRADYVDGASGARNYEGQTRITAFLENADTEASDREMGDTGWKLSLEELSLFGEKTRLENVRSPSSLNAMAKLFTTTAAWKPKTVRFAASVTPGSDFIDVFGQQGPFVAEVTAERKGYNSSNKPIWDFGLNLQADWRFNFEADNENRYFKASSLFVSWSTGKGNAKPLILAQGVVHYDDQEYDGLFMCDLSAVDIMIAVQGMHVNDLLDGFDAAFIISKVDGKWQWDLSGSANLSVQTIADSEILSGLGIDGKDTNCPEDFMVSAQLDNSGRARVEFQNFPLQCLNTAAAGPQWVELEKVRTLSLSRRADKKWVIIGEVDTIIHSLVDENSPRDDWPRFTLGMNFSPEGYTFYGQNLAFEHLCKDGKNRDGAVTFTNLSIGKSKTDSEWTGDLGIKVNPCNAWKDAVRQMPMVQIDLPDELDFTGSLSSKGKFLLAANWTPPPKVHLIGDLQVELNQFVIKKQSPLSFGINSKFYVGDEAIDSTVSFGNDGLHLSLPADYELSFPVPGDYQVAVNGFEAVLGPEFTIGGNASVSIPEGNPLRSVVGEKFEATLAGSTTEFAISTPTHLNATLDLGQVGTASMSIDNLALSSAGSFAGTGTITINDQSVDLVVSSGPTSLAFMADFGEAGIDAEVAGAFVLKLREQLGLKTFLGMQMLQIDDMYIEIGNEQAGFSASAEQFKYFLPSSIPPAGFPFFDDLEGNVHIVGFAVNVGMEFPAPNGDDLQLLLTTLTPALSGGSVDWEALGGLHAPAVGVHDVYVKLPKVEGYRWDNATKTMTPTDDQFAAMFGSNRLDLVDRFHLGPKEVVQFAKAADDPLQLIKAVIPAEHRAGSAAVKIAGFDAGLSYNLREDATIYEEHPVEKLDEVDQMLRKIRVAESQAEQPAPGTEGDEYAQSVALPAELGGGAAQVVWERVDLGKQLQAAESLLGELTPPVDKPLSEHLSYMWQKLSSYGGYSFNGNHGVVEVPFGDVTMQVDFELHEYDGAYDVSGLLSRDGQLFARFGQVSLYSDVNQEGDYFPLGSDVSDLSEQSFSDRAQSLKVDGRGRATLYSGSAFSGSELEIEQSSDDLAATSLGQQKPDSVRLYYPLTLNDVTRWTLSARTSAGLLLEIDSGAVSMTLPGGARALTMLDNSWVSRTITDARTAFDELAPWPALDNNPNRYLEDTWSRLLQPIASSAEVDGATLKFNLSEDAQGAGPTHGYGLTPLSLATGQSVTGVKLVNGQLQKRLGKITLFQDASQSGTSLEITDDYPDLGETPFGRDVASSVRIEGGATATLYSETGYGQRWEYDYTKIKPKLSSAHALDVSGYSVETNAQIILWNDNDGQDNQVFKFVPVGDDGYFNVVAKHSDKCLVAQNNTTKNGELAVQYPCTSSSNRIWKPVPQSDGSYRIVEKHGDMCLNLHQAKAEAGATVNQWGCTNYDHDSLHWNLDLKRIDFSPVAISENLDWLGDVAVGDNNVRAVKVFTPLGLSELSTWSLQRSLPHGGLVYVGMRQDEEDGSISPFTTIDIPSEKFRIKAFYAEDGTLSVVPTTLTGLEYPLTGVKAYVDGRESSLASLTELTGLTEVWTKNIVVPGASDIQVNEVGGITATIAGTVVQPRSDNPAVSSFTLLDGFQRTYAFAASRVGGVDEATITGSGNSKALPLYKDSAGHLLGIKEPVGTQEGGFFADAHLTAGSAETVRLDLHVSGAIKTDGNYYFAGNGDLVIANYTVSEAEILLSSEQGLKIKGKMDLYGIAQADIDGYLSPNGQFSFTGHASIMVDGTGAQGSFVFDNHKLSLVGGIYIANTPIKTSTFTIADGKVSWQDNMSVGFAGVDMTTTLSFVNPYGAGFDARAYLDVDLPVRTWGVTRWKCGKVWGVKVCWPKSYGWITVGSISTHFNQHFSGAVSGSSLELALGPGKLAVDVAKPSVSVKW